MTDVRRRSKIDCPLFFLCLFDDLSFALYFGHLPCWQFFALVPLQDVHCLEHRNKFVHKVVMTQRIGSFPCNAIFVIFLLSSFQTLPRRFASFYDACMLSTAVVVFAAGFLAMVVLDLTRHRCFHKQFQLFRAFFMVSLNSLSSGSMK